MPINDCANKANAILEIQRIAAELEEGQDTRCVCPYCGGGSTNERSMSIRRGKKHKASFICFRAHCDLSPGKVMLVGDNKVVFNSKTKNNVSHQTKMQITTLPLWKSLARMLNKKYGLTDELLVYGNVRAMRDGRVAFTIFGPKSRRRRGYVLRKYADHYRGKSVFSSVPKALNHFLHEKTVGLSWYFKGRHKTKQTDTLVLVEDIVSALRLNPYIDSCALLGTLFEPKRQKEVKEMKYKKIIMALDNDARRTATAIKRQVETYLPGLIVKFLDKDIKDMSEDELKTFIEGIT